MFRVYEENSYNSKERVYKVCNTEIDAINLCGKKNRELLDSKEIVNKHYSYRDNGSIFKPPISTNKEPLKATLVYCGDCHWEKEEPIQISLIGEPKTLYINVEPEFNLKVIIDDPKYSRILIYSPDPDVINLCIDFVHHNLEYLTKRKQSLITDLENISSIRELYNSENSINAQVRKEDTEFNNLFNEYIRRMLTGEY